MIPGMSERERLAADMERLEWLADAALGPRRLSRARHAGMPSGSRYTVPLDLCSRGFALAQDLNRRVRTIRPRSTWSLLDAAPGQENS
jgi:hypothetical protein